MNNFEEQPNAEGDAPEPGGSLADAIAAHLELKKEHGADPEEVAAEEAAALSAANRDEDEVADVVEEVPEAEVPEPEVPEPEVPEPEVPVPEPEAEVPEPEPEPAAEVASTEETGNFDFKFGEKDPEPEPAKTSEEIEHDLLEDTPDFFEETPEHDKLWFDEAPPKPFNF